MTCSRLPPLGKITRAVELFLHCDTAINATGQRAWTALQVVSLAGKYRPSADAGGRTSPEVMTRKGKKTAKDSQAAKYI